VAATEPAPRIVLPSASAAYLNNPPPAYPALSRRLGEQGRVLLRVRIEPDGTASAAEIRTSSGYERLDQAALQAVLSWRYVPGKRNGVPEAMWFLIPIQFELR
jgi:protein TonB